MISQEIKREYNLPNIEKLENYVNEYRKRYVDRITLPKGRIKRALGYIGSIYLFRALQKSKYLYLGFIDSINSKNSSIAYLSVRSHLEITAALGYLNYNLTKYYSEKMKYTELEILLNRLFLGSKSEPYRKSDSLESINVLTMIETTDKYILSEIKGESNLVDKNEKHLFSTVYANLSERCHPNCEGLSFGSRYISAAQIYFFSEAPHLGRKQELDLLISQMLLSCDFYFYFHDRCYSLLRSNEQLPNIYFLKVTI